MYTSTMNNLNSNFLENDEMYEGQTVEEIVEEIFEEEEQEEAQNEILSEAEKRIEQANLYQALLKHDLFGPGSARQEIIDSVRREFKGFILSRLEVLLGIKPETSKVIQKIESPFSEEEVNALKAIANRLVKKDIPQTSQAPTVNSIQPSQSVTLQKPVINTIGGETPQKSNVVTKKVVKKTVISKPSNQMTDSQVTQEKKRGRKSTENISEITGQDYGQVAITEDPALRPKAMPSQAEMDMLNARQAEMNSRGASPVAGETGATGLGAKIAAQLLKS